jgi:hypothetical protein
MTLVRISRVAPRALVTNQWVRNGKIPDAEFQNALASHSNHAARILTKEAFSYSCPVEAIPSATGSSRDRWRFAWHTGPYATSIFMQVLVSTTDGSGGTAGAAPAVTLTVTDGGGTIGTAVFNHGTIDNGAADSPLYFAYGGAVLKSAGAEVAIDADTDYYGLITDTTGGRVIAVTIYESSLTSDTANGYVGDVQTGGPIYDEDRGDVATILRAMWKSGAAHLLNWTVDNQAAPRTTTSATEANLIETTLTGGSAYGSAAPGFLLDLANRTRVKDTGPKIKVAVYASRGTSDGAVILASDNGTAIAQVNITGAAAWYTATATVDLSLWADDANAKCHLVFASGGGTCSVYAVSVYQYET